MLPLAFRRGVLGVVLSLSLAAIVTAASSAPCQVTSPREHFGFAIGDDYQLATYTQTEAYFKKLAGESDRVKLVDIGKTEEGRTQWMMVVSAPANLRRLGRFREIAQKLARAENIDDRQAQALAADGKAIVWIDGGLHANETAGAHQLIETVWQLASGRDPETLRILRDVIVLCVHANPDGQELVANGYLREPVPQKRVLTPAPRLYQKYIGHDNNRDFYLSAMRETTNLNRQLYLEWYPQIVYNHHQPGPAGAVMFVPPFRDPFNYHYDPLVVTGIQALGTAIQLRLLEEGKTGVTSRSGANYSTWFNGSLRTTAYFHNMIGLLTESVGGPTPAQIPFVPARQLPSSDLTAPVAPQVWHFRQTIDYEVAANRAVLDYAARHREQLLLDIYRMGRNAIARGERDEWTARPSRLAAVTQRAAAERPSAEETESGDAGENSAAAPTRLPAKYYEQLHRPEWRDPRGFILPADQSDFPTAVKFVNALVKTGVVIHRATAEFTVAGKRYPAGSYVVKTNQAFRAHVLDMFEPQDHPNDFVYPGGPPIKPYDVTGYTLAFQMGVQFDRVLDGFDGPFERLPLGVLQSPPATAILAPGSGGYLIDHRVNDSAILVNRLLKARASVFWLKTLPADVPDFGDGAIYVPAGEGVRAVVERGARELGLRIRVANSVPLAGALKLAPVRIALWDRYGGSAASGWTRWLLEQFEFPFTVVFAPQIDAGHLRERYDALILVSGSVPSASARPAPQPKPADVPPEYREQLGRITPEKSIPALRAFLENGGCIVAIGSATGLSRQLGLPVTSALVERQPDGSTAPLSERKFYIPGSVLSARVDTAQPIAWGMPEHADFFFDRSPAFARPMGAEAPVITPVVTYDSAAPLRSGWAWGQEKLAGSVAVAQARVGTGTLWLMGPEIAFRGQTHGTFKLLFNALHLANATEENALPAE